MQLVSTLQKMSVIPEKPVKYMLSGETHFLKMNDLIGREIKVDFLNEKYCCECRNQFAQLFRMGFCRDCFFNSPQAGESIIRPELSKAHLGEEDRDLAFEKSYQLQTHIVYLAKSGGLKVGVTRANSSLNRWIDQGASEAMIFAQTSNRYEAGLIEVDLKNHVADKTVWQRMLKNEVSDITLQDEKQRLKSLLKADLQKFVTDENEIYSLEYPVKVYAPKVRGINLDKDKEIKAKLQGIRGQYLMFEGGAALNIRAHSGYRVKISF